MALSKLLSACALTAALLLSFASDADARRDRDNNPPGPLGGRGTNWENPRGPVGGPGASPDRHWRRDHDGNPPGPVGGPGTNWENPPGPWGGPGASPDHWRRHWRHTYWSGVVWVWHPVSLCWFPDHDGNPPGAAGGPGTNWENPPGPIGGPGASPDRRACY